MHVRWHQKSDLSSIARTPVRFKFSVGNGKLSSFWVSKTTKGDSSGCESLRKHPTRAGVHQLPSAGPIHCGFDSLLDQEDPEPWIAIGETYGRRGPRAIVASTQRIDYSEILQLPSHRPSIVCSVRRSLSSESVRCHGSHSTRLGIQDNRSALPHGRRRLGVVLEVEDGRSSRHQREECRLPSHERRQRRDFQSVCFRSAESSGRPPGLACSEQRPTTAWAGGV